MHNTRNIVGILTAVTLMCGAVPGDAAQSPNPRSSSNGASLRTPSVSESNMIQRSATNVTARSQGSRGAPGRVSARGAIVSNAMRGASSVARPATDSATVSRSGTMARTAQSPSGTVRSATNNGASRTSLSRATAVFSDVSKIGGGYASCRDAYATCMDQFCANANDKYRRCFCSSRFTDFSNTEAALDQAKTLLMQFEDNNLNAVDKTAAEVNAMYSATVGEAAIKKDTSGAAQILDQVSDLLSGKTKVTKSNNDSGSFILGSLNLDSLSTSGDLDDIWGGGSSSSSSIFSVGGSGRNIAELEGVNLYNESNKQCVAIIGDSCSSDAMLQMARSSYNIMITQDCNAYEKSIDSKKEAVKQTVRTAEKYLREARLEEYRAHNSADVNECVSKVKTAMLADTACGTNYKRCLDMDTGVYIKPTTGEPVYTQRFFKLTDLIKLDGTSSDILGQNPNFNTYLDGKRMYAASALDTCRDIADTVWSEFKRAALIEIAQAQDEKIEEAKMSCVSTIAQCYDTQTSALKDFDSETAQASGALATVASKAMCQDKVYACASLFGNTEGCEFDGNGKLTGTNAAQGCGINELINFVNMVDTSRQSQACDPIVDNYLTELCTPTSGKYGYPYNCRAIPFGTEDIDYYPTKKDETGYNTNTLYAMVGRHVQAYCGTDMDTFKNSVLLKMDNLRSDMRNILSDICENTYDGTWTYAQSEARNNALNVFYTTIYPDRTSTQLEEIGSSWGYCIPQSKKIACLRWNTTDTTYATYNATTGECTFTSDWYKTRCNDMSGVWEDDVCYVPTN